MESLRSVDVGIYVLPGRVKDPGRAITEAAEAERLGFSRAWLAERYDLKEAGALLGGMAAATSTIGLGTAVVATASRSPLLTAALGATMSEAYGNRFALGIGRGLPWQILNPLGMNRTSMAELEEYAITVRGLWEGRTLAYDGPVGSGPALRLADPPSHSPELCLGTRGGPRAAEIAAAHFDSVMLSTFFNVQAVEGAVATLRAAASRIGRDPASLKIYHMIVTAPELSDDEVLALAHARAVTYFQLDGHWQGWVRHNGWDPEKFHRLAARLRDAGFGSNQAIDQAHHRGDLLEFARLVPDEWMYETSAIGSIDNCVETLARYAATGIDEFIVHGSSPSQNAKLLEAWKARTSGPNSSVSPPAQ